MEKNILRQLYEGEIHPEEHKAALSEDEEAERKALLRRQEEFYKELGAEYGEKFMEIMEEAAYVKGYELEASFVEGMRMGGQIVFAMLGKEEKRKA